ncbi:hypothetical protein C3L33_09470, partial [Rhododendron williamsianum]
MEKQLLGYESIDLSRPNIANELKIFLQRHQLPLGKDSRTGITELVASVGHSCEKSVDLLSEYMSYKVNGFALMIGALVCKARGKNDFLINDVLNLGSGGIRIGFDLGGGSGTFAARMAERNVTVVTATLNIDAPFSEFIAARGLFPLYLSLDHRFPFHDNVFDIVHTGSALDVGGRPEKLEFLMFDIDRILRAGGLFWLDNFSCASDEKKNALTRLIERFGIKS